MKKTSSKSLNVRNLPLAGILTALVIILQLISTYIQPIPGVSITLVLVPIVIGASLLGPYVGVWLGFVFGLTVLLSGGANMFLAINVPGTVIICLLKGALAGLAVSFVYRLLKSKNEYFAVICSAVVCPVVNTGIFMIGCRLFYWQTVQELAAANGFSSAALYLFIGFAGINFIIELAINCVLAPVILRLTKIGKGMMKNH